MRGILSLAVITFKEGIRNRSLFGIALLALFLFGLNISVAGFFMRDIGKVTVDMNLSALSVAGLLLVFFVGVNLMAKDIDRKTIHLVLSKPISRIEYIWGKYLGILFFVFVSLAILLALSSATVFFLHGAYSDYFGQFTWAVFFVAAFFVFIKIALLGSIVVFFSSITSNSFITLIFSVCAFIVGSTIEEVLFYLRSSFAAKELAISDSLRHLLDIVSYLVPNLSVFDFKTEAAHGLVIGLDRFGFSLAYAVVYIIVLLSLASLIFRRREFN